MTGQSVQAIGGRIVGAMSPALWVAACCVLVVLVCAIGGGAVAPGSPDMQRLLVGDTPPSAEFWAGTDKLGRDVLARTVAGARTALIGPTVVAAGAFAIATVLGLIAGYFGGWIDNVIMRGVDIILALPGPLIAIVVVGVTGGGYWTAVSVLIVLFVAPDTRIVRSAVLVQRSQPYIEAARIQNIPRHRILFVHILPNVMPIILSYAVLDFAFALVNLAGLSFLGLGVEPGTADWGRMLFENRNILFTNPAALLLPAAMIVVTAGSINMLGDRIREAVAK
ncbi:MULTISPECIES: ABC transporter permease [Meridianimarinicoccus]|uniref:ABC transporter permease n=1 Tax=Meridianimarinicoccus zhengii TaxID=2056810 RepID=UPI000DAF3E0F|nr:ABC transporter permease [Phycocomes zhengii]